MKSPSLIYEDCPYDARVMCRVSALEYDFKSHAGVLHMPLLNCTHMSGCIALFMAIDPGVLSIQTVNADGRDTAYVRRDAQSEWEVNVGYQNGVMCHA